MLELSEKVILKSLVPTRAYRHKLNKLCEPLFRALGFNQVTLYYIKQNQWIIIHSDLTWAKYYFNNCCYKVDINLSCPENITDHSFWWRDNSCNKEFLEHMVKPAERLFNMYHGFSIVKKYQDGYFLVSFSSGTNEMAVYNKIFNEIYCIKQFVAYIYKEFLLIIITRLRSYMLDLTAIKPYLPNCLVSCKTSEDRLALLAAVGLIPTQLKRISLSGRECECIRWYLDGYNARETAEMLNISRRTVEGHIASIKAKLRCRYKKELFDKIYILKILSCRSDILNNAVVNQYE